MCFCLDYCFSFFYIIQLFRVTLDRCIRDNMKSSVAAIYVSYLRHSGVNKLLGAVLHINTTIPILYWDKRAFKW